MLVLVGYTMMFRAVDVPTFTEAFRTSGSSLLTLGFLQPRDLPGVTLAFSEASIGLGLLALLIAYLPTIYGTFSRREVLVAQMSVRAGIPPSAEISIARDEFDALYDRMAAAGVPLVADPDQALARLPRLAGQRRRSTPRVRRAGGGALRDVVLGPVDQLPPAATSTDEAAPLTGVSPTEAGSTSGSTGFTSGSGGSMPCSSSEASYAE